MKIVCGSCQAKYSIADEKVAGKVFKIRCKRCGEVIVVRGDQEAPQEAAAASYDAADAIWHVVINGEQAGPYAPLQLAEMLTSGHIDWEAYVWCEGFDNWAPMRDVPDLVAAITGQGQSQEQQEHATAYTPAQAQPSMGADPFADDGGGGGGMFAEPAPAARSQQLFGGSQESPFDDGPRVVASAPSPRVSAEQAMTGSRNENSVLFSLKNLQALATGSSTTAAPTSTAPAPMSRAGYAGGEGSGLIDIRALASATGVAETQREDSEKDALLSLGSAQTGAFGALGSPMLAPVGGSDEGSKKGIMFAILGGFALLAVAAVAIALIVVRPQAPAPVPSVAPALPPTAAAPVAANPAPGAAPTEAPSEGELAAKRAAAAAARGNTETEKQRSGGGHGSKRREAGGGADKAQAAGDTSPARSEPVAAAKAADKPKAKGGSSSIDELLDGAIGGGGSGKAAAKKEREPAVDPNLQDKPSREDVIAAMKGVQDAVKTCAGSQSGVAFANVTVAGKSGRVSGVEITGVTGEAGSCIARAVRKASFPKFRSDTFQVKFPFRL